MRYVKLAITWPIVILMAIVTTIDIVSMWLGAIATVTLIALAIVHAIA